jgi:hypothetical protein
VIPVVGHPYALARIVPNRDGTAEITCQCRACGDVWRRRCTYPPKAGAWIYRYGALHSHGVPGLRESFAARYHLALHALRSARTNTQRRT